MKKIFVGVLICIFLITAIIPIAGTATIIDNTSEFTNPEPQKIHYMQSAWAEGSASSGKQYGFLGKMAIIKFDYVKFSKLRLNPIRWEMVDFMDVTAIVIGLNQEIPEGPFDFERDRISAIVFE